MTETVHYVAVFTLDARPVAGRLLADTLDSRRLAATIPGFTVRETAVGTGALLAPDRPEGTSRVPSLLLEGTIDGDFGSADILVGHTGTAALVLEREVPDGAILPVEDDLGPLVAPTIAAIARSASSLTATGLTSPWPPGSMQTGRLLWWHRLVVTGRPAPEVAEALAYGTDVETRTGRVGTVGGGFSVLDPDHANAARGFVRGLFAATEEWFIVDEIDRRLSRWVQAVGADERTLTAARDEARLASVDLVARQALIEERARYLVATACGARVAARRAWGVEDEARSITDRLAEMRRLADEEGQRRQARRDSQRNDLLFVFTIMAVLQTVLVIFDFVTSGDQELGSPVRLVIAAVVTVAGLALLVRVAIDRRRSGDAG